MADVVNVLFVWVPMFCFSDAKPAAVIVTLWV
jgi:hypothetical protein